MRIEDLPPGRCLGVVFHWSAGRYTTYFSHYHVCCLGPPQDGKVLITHPFANNLKQIRPGDVYAAHTKGRNSYRLGIAAMAMYGATMANAGAYPVTPKQIESLAAVAGLMIVRYGLTDDQLKTHYEWARIDAYFPQRWDFMHMGDVLRRKARWYATRV